MEHLGDGYPMLQKCLGWALSQRRIVKWQMLLRDLAACPRTRDTGGAGEKMPGPHPARSLGCLEHPSLCALGATALMVQKFSPAQNIPQSSRSLPVPQTLAPWGPGLNPLGSAGISRTHRLASKTPVYSFSSQGTSPNSWLVMRRGEYSAGLPKGRTKETAGAPGVATVGSYTRWNPGPRSGCVQRTPQGLPSSRPPGMGPASRQSATL